MEYYDETKVHDGISLIKHKIATKQILVNLEDEILDITNITKFISIEKEDKSAR